MLNYNFIHNKKIKYFFFFLLIIFIVIVGYQKIYYSSISSIVDISDPNYSKKLLYEVIESDKKPSDRTGIFMNGFFYDKKIISSEYKYVGFFNNNLVVKNKESNQYFRFDFTNYELVSLNLPVIKNNGDQYEEVLINNSLLKNTTQLLLTVFTYDRRDPINELIGSRMPIKRIDYLYDFNSNKFEEFEVLTTIHKLLGDNGLGVSGYGLLAFDEDKHLAYLQYSHMAGVGEVLVINTLNQKIVQTLWKDEKVEILPSDFFINPNFGLGLYVNSDKDNFKIITVSLQDINTSINEVDLIEIKKRYYDQTEARITLIKWLSDEKVLLGFDYGILLVNLTTSNIEIIYEDNTLGQGYTHWNFNEIITDGISSVALVDYYSNRYEDCVGGKVCPSREPEDNRYRVLVKNITNNYKKVVSDGPEYKHVIGWIDLSDK